MKRREFMTRLGGATHRRLGRSLSWCETSHRCRLRRSALQTLRATAAAGGLIKISADDRLAQSRAYGCPLACRQLRDNRTSSAHREFCRS
jgi:hypothetical protein